MKPSGAQALSLSELRYRRLFETAQDGILLLEFDSGRITDANPFILGLLGYALADLVGKLLWEIGVIVDQQQSIEAFAQLKRQGYIRYENMALEAADGRRLEVEFISHAYPVGDEQVIQCNIRDISDRVAATEALRISALSYRRLFETAQDGILLLEFDSGWITDANPFILELLVCAREDVVGKQLWELGFLIDKTESIEAFNTLKREGFIRYDSLPLRTSGGRHLELEFVCNAYLVGTMQVIQCNIRDISERVAAQRLADRYRSEVKQSMVAVVSALVAMTEARDPYTAGHQQRVSELAVAMAKEMELEASTIDGLRIAGLLHDIGKFAIPAELLTKPSTLTHPEWLLMQGHVESGYEVLRLIPFPWPVAEAVLQHHCRLDGSGYPHGLEGGAIGLGGRILAVADTMEAMATPRPYRFVAGLDVALSTIEAGSGTLFDPTVVEACTRLFREKRFAFSEGIVKR